MPAGPFGGLSFFLNLIVVLLGAIIRFLRKKGFGMNWLYNLSFLITGRKTDKWGKQSIGYGIMLVVLMFISVSAGTALIDRLQSETNIELISHTASIYYQTNKQFIPRTDDPYLAAFSALYGRVANVYQQATERFVSDAVPMYHSAFNDFFEQAETLYALANEQFVSKAANTYQ